MNLSFPVLRLKLKKDIISSMLSGPNSAQALRDLGQHVTSLTPKQLSNLPKDNLKDALQNLGSSVEWSRNQLRSLAKNQLGSKKVSL